MKSYWEVKTTLQAMIPKIKEVDPERGGYLEKHLRFNDLTNTFSYTGKKAVINTLLKRIKILD